MKDSKILQPISHSSKPDSAHLNQLYLSQMLKFSGVFTARSAFGGGSGEAQFASFLREAYAAELSEALTVLPVDTFRT